MRSVEVYRRFRGNIISLSFGLTLNGDSMFSRNVGELQKYIPSLLSGQHAYRARAALSEHIAMNV
jgi:hypothetical protein